MKTYQATAFIAIQLLWSSGMGSQTTQTQSNQIILAITEIVHSKILNEKREVWVYVPKSASDETYSKQRYPVAYILDAEAYFYSAAGLFQYLGAVLACPEMVVVGIPNTDRQRDLTPTHSSSIHILDIYLDTNFCRTSGGGEKFMSFIEKELMPHIDSLYPTAPYRMLIGHSNGGLTIMNTLIHHTRLFNSYVCLDPGMLWDNKRLLLESKKALAINNYSGISLFLGIANTMHVGMDTTLVKSDTTLSTQHIRSIFELRDCLSNNKQNQLNYTWKYYDIEDHITLPLIAEYDALHFIFNSDNFKLTLRDYFNIDKEGITKIENHYDKLSKQFGYKVNPPERLINGLGLTALYNKHLDDAFYLLKLNATNYSDSWNAYDSLGDYYSAIGDKKQAIDNFKNALSLKEVPGTKLKLENLQWKQ